ELNMGDSQTLVNFLTWARERYPAQYYYLAIADHGRGTTGIAWDNNRNNEDYLTTAELRTALSTATNSGQWKVNVLHYDTCLMALLENAYQVKDYVDYLVASQNLAWSAFAYATYVHVQGAQEVPAPYEFANVAAQVTPSTTPRQLAVGVVDAYFNHPGVQGYPRTISALDLSRVTAVRQAVDTFATALRDNLNTIKTYIQNARNATQKFDSRDYYRITNDDEYLDLYHFAERVKQYVSVGDVQAAAQGVMNAIEDGFVVAERHRSGVWEGEEALYWDLDNAHGVAIYFPPRSGSLDYSQYTSHQLFSFTGEGQWDEFLVDYFGVMGLPPDPSTAPGLPPMLAPDYKEVYLPVIMRSR
ncbi:MAG: clostripain-related cysteine peptidase, partial [Anaerolineae bacterium]|nr:clostripain-related cysteine peptidase [Anaerolineae bacterium]